MITILKEYYWKKYSFSDLEFQMKKCNLLHLSNNWDGNFVHSWNLIHRQNITRNCNELRCFFFCFFFYLISDEWKRSSIWFDSRCHVHIETIWTSSDTASKQILIICKIFNLSIFNFSICSNRNTCSTNIKW